MNKIHKGNKKKIQPNTQLWSKNDHVATPDDLYNALDAEFHFDFDPCPLRAKFDGLARDWGKSNYVNPPYSNIKVWMQKAIEEMKKGNRTVFLIPLRMGSKYWERYVYGYAKEVRVIAGYIKFKGYEDIRGLNTPIGLVIYDPVWYKRSKISDTKINRNKVNETSLNSAANTNNIAFSELGGCDIIAINLITSHK